MESVSHIFISFLTEDENNLNITQHSDEKGKKGQDDRKSFQQHKQKCTDRGQVTNERRYENSLKQCEGGQSLWTLDPIFFPLLPL